MKNIIEQKPMNPDSSTTIDSVNGQVWTVTKSPELFRDVMPYFQLTYILVGTIAMLLWTENFFLPLWLFFLVSPLGNVIGVGDNQNLSI